MCEWLALLRWSGQSPGAHNCSLLNHTDSFCGGMFKPNTKFDACLWLCLFSHFECNNHTVHMITQQHLPPSLSDTVKSSLFTHAHSSPLSMADRFQGCCANQSHYINNGCTFSRQTNSYCLHFQFINMNLLFILGGLVFLSQLDAFEIHPVGCL